MMFVEDEGSADKILFLQIAKVNIWARMSKKVQDQECAPRSDPLPQDQRHEWESAPCSGHPQQEQMYWSE
jgi:hypothetical protein